MPSGLAVAMAGITKVYFAADISDIEAGGSKWGIVFVAIGIVLLISSVFQGWCFAVMA